MCLLAGWQLSGKKDLRPNGGGGLMALRIRKCPWCDKRMQRLYMRESARNGKFQAIGWICPDAYFNESHRNACWYNEIDGEDLTHTPDCTGMVVNPVNGDKTGNVRIW